MNLRDFFGVGTKLKESIFKSNSQINSTVTIRTWVYQQNGPDRDQVQDWYPGEKMVVDPTCLNGGCCYSLTRVKPMILCFFYLFEDMLSIQFV